MSAPYSIVQISDTHFGTERKQVMRALEARINAIEPQLLIISGDITQRARPYQFQRAHEFLRRLRYGALLCVPGNHDIMPLYYLPLRLMTPNLRYHRHMKHWEQRHFEDQGVRIIGLDSCNPWHYKNGRLSQNQLSTVQKQLRDTPDDWLKILVAHHPFDATRPHDEENIMPQAETALEHLGKAGVDLVMGGHIHVQFCRSLHHRYPNLSRTMAVCQAGTAFSSRVRAGLPNSFMELKPGAQKQDLLIQQWDFVEGECDFEATARFQPLQPEAQQSNPYEEEADTQIIE